MKVHLVGGFLGSGKTTSIIRACEMLTAQGRRVGVITNDQGRYLVDTALFRASSLPTVEVTGGCFCCRFDDFQEMVHRLEAGSHPDVVFAESVGSCSDIVATVVRPAGLGPAGIKSFSVFVDIRLLRLWLAGERFPFSEEVVYLFSKQIEEAQLVVVNKSDLLSREECEAARSELCRRFPEKRIRVQSAFSPDDIGEWIAAIEAPGAGEPVGGRGALEIDYDRYAAAEASLAWYDATVVVDAGQALDVSRSIASRISERCELEGRPVGRIKLADADNGRRVIINARVESRPEELAALVRESLAEVCAKRDVKYAIEAEECFRPAYPRPSHRRV